MGGILLVVYLGLGVGAAAVYRKQSQRVLAPGAEKRQGLSLPAGKGFVGTVHAREKIESPSNESVVGYEVLLEYFIEKTRFVFLQRSLCTDVYIKSKTGERLFIDSGEVVLEGGRSNVQKTSDCRDWLGTLHPKLRALEEMDVVVTDLKDGMDVEIFCEKVRTQTEEAQDYRGVVLPEWKCISRPLIRVLQQS